MEQRSEAFHHTQTTSIEELSNQINSLSSKIEQSVQSIKDNNTLPRVDFPKFSGKDFGEWLYKVNQFFELYGCSDSLPDHSKVRLASIHLEGEALRWHLKKFPLTGNPESINWKEYVREIEMKFGERISASTSDSDSKHLVVEGKKKRRRICKLGQIYTIPELKASHLRFGPLYHTKTDLTEKEEAWQLVLKKSTDRASATTEIYMSSIRRIEKDARDCYADGAADCFTGSYFRWMMILDGCFFLQLALYILGGQQQLGYPPDHSRFGKRGNNVLRFRDVKEVIESMFFVGNQVPVVVVRELMKQNYFQKVIEEGKWKKPTDLYKKILYELLILPELESRRSRGWRMVKGVWRKVSEPRVHWMQQQNPTDLLHGLQLLVLGPELDHDRSNSEEEDEEEEFFQDLEAQQGPVHDSDMEGEIYDKVSSSAATELKQGGIHFWTSTRIGSRGIRYSNSMWFCHGYAILYLPPMEMEDDTELMFRCLRDYEMSQKFGRSRREFCSYLRFMSELIRTPDDARLIASQGMKKHKLPGILRRLASTDNYNHNLRLVKLKISDYSPPIWKKYWQIISFGLIITVLQTVYTILPYYKS